MTVREVISILSEFDPDMRVLVDGYEYGYDDLIKRNIYQMQYSENYYVDESWAGPHEKDAKGNHVGIVLGRGTDVEIKGGKIV